MGLRVDSSRKPKPCVPWHARRVPQAAIVTAWINSPATRLPLRVVDRSGLSIVVVRDLKALLPSRTKPRPQTQYPAGNPLSRPIRHVKEERPRISIPTWAFTNEFAIDQPATFSFSIDCSRFASRHAFLHHKRVVVVRPRLPMKWRNTKAAAIGDNIANPMGPQRTSTRTAFSPLISTNLAKGR